MKASVLGCGRWGSFLAWYLSAKEDVVLWGRESGGSYRRLRETGGNEYLRLPENVRLTSDLGEAMERELIVISIGAQGLRAFTEELKPYGLEHKTVLLCMKGLEEETGARLSEIVNGAGVPPERVAVWLGPGHIQEFVSGKPNCMVIDSANHSLAIALADWLRSDLIRFYYGNDLIGSEIGGAAKNVMGIAAGMLDGGGYGALKGVLMARGAREVSRLIAKMGGNELSAYGLCHLGDYETTLFSPYSNNRAYGEAFVKGERFLKLAEGVATAHAMTVLGARYGEELPITNAVYSILKDKTNPMQVFLTLFSRSARTEF